ncbi:translation initiation factor 2 [Streptomyces nanshensis]|uniref:Translation initiation factor 2 n=1 Tax=Streptomyces nanshensis TaxID=518642 RepID=A0A1E7L023_9ACTN|nr:translation initiation factor 2 [Streptomyces nanshensis]OEV09481.1 translation initiation factor 2 [Streptomyces nanshensis]
MLFAARSATALQRLLDVAPVFAGDGRVTRRFTLVPGSDFDADALTALEDAKARTIPWSEACEGVFDLVLTASPKGHLSMLEGPRVLLPHGAGFSKALPSEGSADSASGLDPAFLLSDGEPTASFHALAHPRQLAQLTALSPKAAERAAVVGDPTLERLLDSVSQRDRFRDALGTGARRLVVLTSTWGPESLLRRRPGMPAELATGLPHDSCQLALIVHPNEHSRDGSWDLAEQLAPALDAGAMLARPYEEWASLLIAADVVITDHGSTALYAAALGRPLMAAYDGGHELIPASPMAELLAASPRLRTPVDIADIDAALGAQQESVIRALADSAFAERGRALGLLRDELYRLLGLQPPPEPARTRPLPAPRHPARTPSAFAVQVETGAGEIRVERFAPSTERSAHHLAAEHGAANERQLQSAGLVFRRPSGTAPGPHSVAWTVDGWTAHIMDRYPGRRTAAVVLSPSRCLLRTRSSALMSVEIGPHRDGLGRIVRTDPAAVLSAVHAWLPASPELPATVVCRVGGQDFRVSIAPATGEEGDYPV